MKKTHYLCHDLCLVIVTLLQIVVSSLSNGSAQADSALEAEFDTVALAAKHAIRAEGPAYDFFAGGLMGNGAMGVVVCSKPDSVIIHFGHNNVWDTRAETVPPESLSNFEQLWGKYKSGDRGWLAAYNKSATVPDSKAYPRPWPCGTLMLAFDPRDAELMGQTVHLDSGICEVRFLVGKQLLFLRLVAEMNSDRLWMKMVDEQGKSVRAPFLRVTLTPAPGFPATTYADENSLSFRQLLPSGKAALDQAVSVGFRSSYDLEKGGAKQAYQPSPPNLKGEGDFIGCVEIRHGEAQQIPESVMHLPEPTNDLWNHAVTDTGASWKNYWSRSGVALEDEFLERIWYRNQYFMNCVCRPGSLCPGLYGNWMSGNIGTVWHGEYVFDYNIEQTFWGVFSSNHVENHLPYVDMIERILPVAKNWAQRFYQLPGAFFAQIHWPVDTPTIPVPWFGWGNHLAPTPWAVQSLWWHYRYTMDKEFLRNRAFGPMKEAVMFMNAYMRRKDAHGPESPWKDQLFHIHPSQSPEIWPARFGDPAFSDPIADLSLTKFLFHAYLDACRDLNIEATESTLMHQVEEILAKMPAYATDVSPRGGRVLKDVQGASPDAIYNVPNPLMPVFPGEDYGLHSPPEILELAANTWRNQRNEGGNDLVFVAMQGARLGLLDLGKFKRHVNYCLLPNGTCTDLTLEAGGRYEDLKPNDYMARMGIWVENFALPAVINECLLQSYTGELRFFPNWSTADGEAQFKTLRAVGAFLVSSQFRGGKTQWIHVTSEAGGLLKIHNPWQGEASIRQRGKKVRIKGAHWEISTHAGETILITEAGT